MIDLNKATSNKQVQELSKKRDNIEPEIKKKCHDEDCRDSCLCIDCPSYY